MFKPTPIPLVYVAGPFRGKTTWDIEKNVRHAEEYGLEVARLGGMPVIPHANTRFFHGQGDDQMWLNGTMRLMEVCDAMVLIPGWERSTGATAERARFEAMGRGTRVFSLGPMCLEKDGSTRPRGFEPLAAFIQSFRDVHTLG